MYVESQSTRRSAAVEIVRVGGHEIKCVWKAKVEFIMNFVVAVVVCRY